MLFLFCGYIYEDAWSLSPLLPMDAFGCDNAWSPPRQLCFARLSFVPLAPPLKFGGETSISHGGYPPGIPRVQMYDSCRLLSG